MSDSSNHFPEGTASDKLPPWLPRLLVILVVTSWIAFLGWHVIGKFGGLFRTLFLALFLSFAFEPAVNWLHARGWRRGSATGLLLLAAVLVGLALIGLMIPVIVKQVSSLINASPEYIDKVARTLKKCCNIDLSTQHVSKELSNAKASLASYAANLAGNLLGFGAAIIGGVFQIFTTGLFLFYFVAQGPQFRRTVCSLLPPKRQREILRAWEIAIDKTGGYFYSRLLLAVINGGLTLLVLLILRVPFALPLAVFEGVVAEFIPIVGTYLAAVVPLFVALVSRPWPITVVLVIWFIVYQQIENYVLSPRISARTMQLHPAVAFAAVIAGGSLGGVVWAFLSLPVAATIQAASTAYITRHDVVESELTDTGPVTLKGGPGEPGKTKTSSRRAMLRLRERLKGKRDPGEGSSSAEPK